MIATNMLLLHTYLSRLDDVGVAYTVSVDGGPSHGVVAHSPEALHVQCSVPGPADLPSFTERFYNLAAVRQVDVEVQP